MKVIALAIFLAFFPYRIYAQTDAETYFINAEIQLVFGDTLGALINYSNVISVSTHAAERHHCQGYISYLMKKYIEAVEHYSQALDCQPDHPESASIYFDRALAKERLGRKKEAIEDYRRSTEVKPTYLPGYYSVARLYAECQQFDLAIKGFTAVIQLDADHADAYFMRGMAAFKAQNYQAALRDFIKTIELNPDQEAALTMKQMAEISLAIGRYLSEQM